VSSKTFANYKFDEELKPTNVINKYTLIYYPSSNPLNPSYSIGILFIENLIRKFTSSMRASASQSALIERKILENGSHQHHVTLKIELRRTSSGEVVNGLDCLLRGRNSHKRR
jgi:hypothetical protein